VPGAGERGGRERVRAEGGLRGCCGVIQGCDVAGMGRIDGKVGVVGQSCGVGGPRSGGMVVDSTIP